jgi:hypothetical protein
MLIAYIHDFHVKVLLFLDNLFLMIIIVLRLKQKSFLYQHNHLKIDIYFNGDLRLHLNLVIYVNHNIVHEYLLLL